MSAPLATIGPHPAGEVPNRSPVPPFSPPEALPVDTLGRRFHVEWEPHAQITAMGQLVFFSQFLATSGLFARYVASCPLRFTSPNAPDLTNLLGTMVLSSLACSTTNISPHPVASIRKVTRQQ